MMWYYMNNGVQTGPMSELDIIAKIRAGIITRSTLVRMENDNTWNWITQSPCFSSFFQVEFNDALHYKQPQTFGQQNTAYQFDNNPQRNNYVNTTPYQPDFQVSSPQMGTPQMGTPQMGASQMGASQMGASQMGAPQIGKPPMVAPQMGTPQMGTSQMVSPQMGAPYNFTGTQYNFSSNIGVNPVNSVSPAAPIASHPLAERTEPLLPPTPAEAYRASESADSQMNSDVNSVVSLYSDSMRETNAVKESSEATVSSETTENKLSLPAFEQAGNHRRNGKHSSPKTKGRKSSAASKKSAIDSIRNFAKEYPYAFYGVSSILLIAVIVIGFASFRRSHSVAKGLPTPSGPKVNMIVEALPPGKIRVVLDDVRTMGERAETYIEQNGLTSSSGKPMPPWYFWGRIYSQGRIKDPKLAAIKNDVIAAANKKGIICSSRMHYKCLEKDFLEKHTSKLLIYQEFQKGAFMLCSSDLSRPRLCCNRKEFYSLVNCNMVAVNSSGTYAPGKVTSAFIRKTDGSFTSTNDSAFIYSAYRNEYDVYIPQKDSTTLLISLRMDPDVMQDIVQHYNNYVVDILITDVSFKQTPYTIIYNIYELIDCYGDCTDLSYDPDAYAQVNKPWKGYVGTIAAVQVRHKLSGKIIAAAYSDGRKVRTEIVDVKDVLSQDSGTKNTFADDEDNDEEPDESDAEDE